MAQLSRPYQIALAAVALLGLVWAVALRGHGPGQHESTGTAPSPTPAQSAQSQAQAQAKAAAKATPIYHGAAPGVEGLTRAIAKAHGAVATSQRNAAELARHSREASQEGSGGPATASPASGARAAGAHPTAARHVTAPSATRAGAHVKAAKTHGGSASGAGARHGADNRPAMQITVEREVAQGKTVLLLFWNSKSSVDREVRSQTQAMVGSSKGSLALHAAAPNQVGEFGSLTEVVHVYQTPTILIVNRHGVVSTLTGLTDSFALKQLVREAQRADK